MFGFGCKSTKRVRTQNFLTISKMFTESNIVQNFGTKIRYLDMQSGNVLKSITTLLYKRFFYDCQLSHKILPNYM